MSEMIERIARKLCEKAHEDPDAPRMYPPGEPAWTRYIEQIRVTIETMREPTEEMIERGDDHAKGWFASISVTYDSEEVWHAMIDVALN